MQQITSSKKYQNGVQVFWADAGNDRKDFFSFEDLIDQKINALDLLNNPGIYVINVAGHTIESSVAGCGFSSKTCEDEIIITRLFDAPRELAWRVWTEPEFVMQWWGPKGYTSPSCKIDLREGGSYLCSMRSPEGKDFWSAGVYREIKKPERIVCTDSFADEKGNVVPAAYYGMSPDFPLEMLVTVTFDVQAGRTKLTLRHAGIPAGEMRDLTRAGWIESLDKYAGVLGQAVYKKTE
ncbi:MAG: SRPBCC domain-containing protein [Methanoregulaceae archaeon]|nr:MAG: SRPBCC domain-containing protein [Methanoregulaceae archaeon]